MKREIGLVPKLIIAIILGILIGQYAPLGFCSLVVTLSGIFSNFLKFVIPLMILAYVTMGIADLSQGAGKLLLFTVILAYGSTLIGGTISYLVSINLFPSFMSQDAMAQIQATADQSVASFFSISIPPMFDTLSAVVLAFILGLCLSTMRGKEIGSTLYEGMKDFSGIIDKVLHKVIIPLLPLYILGTFVDMTRSGKTFAILSILWKVFIVVIIMHLCYLFVQFIVAGTIAKKNPFTLMKNQIPGYTTALGTQSSAATIPVNLECAKHDGITEQIRNFVVPLCANIHMCGSMITITACATAGYEWDSYQFVHGGSVHYDSGYCDGCLSRSTGRFHYDGAPLPLYDFRKGTGRSERTDLCYHGGSLHYTGFFRNSLQCIRRQCNRSCSK